MTIGERISRARKEVRLTQAQLAKQCGVATITIQQYELNKRQPRFEQLQRIADALNVSLFYLVDATDESGDDMVVHAVKQELDLSVNLDNIAAAMKKLNHLGQQEAVKRVDELTEIAKYQR